MYIIEDILSNNPNLEIVEKKAILYVDNINYFIVY